ncbi:MAG TPA: choice-of-anchor tandem repeat NxxGxxAF-containing protein [Acidobacteriota bacterium]|nr:choice-of-anchor tandem repeat NxxGxxAF-containing protein [Acidobacteriota bacterium]
MFSSVGRPAINNLGDIAFRADLSGTGLHSGIFHVASGMTPTNVALFGDTIANVPQQLTDFGNPVLNDTRQIAFNARIGDGYDNQGVFLKTTSGITPIARTGESAAGTPSTFGNRFCTFGLALNNSGIVAFEATLQGSVAGDGVFKYSNGKIDPVAVTGQAAPGTQGGLFSRFTGLSMNQSGQIAFVATLDSGGATQGVFLASSAGITAIALHGQTIPNDADAIDTILQPSIDDLGNVAFVDSIPIRGRVGANTLPRRILIASAGILSSFASVGTQIGSETAILKGNFQDPRLVSSAGNSGALFVAWRSQRGKNALLLYSRGGISQILQEGDPSPVGGVYSFIGNQVFSPSGYYAFVSNLEGSAAKSGIFIDKISW